MSEQYENNEDEISLIDLFAVLIRYRKLIVIGTLAVALAAFAWLFVLPKFVPSLDSGKQTVIYNVKTERLPPSLYSMINYDILTSVISYMKNVSVIADAQKEFSVIVDEKKFSSEKLYNLAVKQAIDQGIFLVEKSDIPGNITVTCTISNAPEKYESLKNFMQKLAKVTSDYIEKSLMPEIDLLEKNADSFIKMYGNATTTASKSGSSTASKSGSSAVTVNYADISADAKAFKSKYNGFVSVSENEFVIPVPSKRSIKFIIAVFAAFFVFVFIAFLMNAVENIKKDTYASNLIKKAWNEGK